MLILIFFVSSVVFVFAKNEFYMGHRVYNVRFDIEDQQDMFYTLKSDLIDYWRKPSLKNNVTGQVMVPPSHFQWFEEKLHELYIKKDIYIEDVYSYLAAKEPSQKSSRNVEDIDLPVFNFNGYFRYYEILDYMRSLESEYSNSNEIKVTYVEAGVTDEGRPLVYLEISSVADGDTEVPIAVVEAGIIPREWITVPSALNIVKELTSQTQLLRGLKWIVIPVVNPDGYEYTHTNLRLWSKNRSTRSNLGFICPGANINRNFDMAWMFSDTSSSPCSHLYGGEEAFSEPESRMIRTIIQNYGRRMKMYVSLQNGGGYVAYPWHYERAASGMFRQHHLLGMEIVNILGNQHALDIGFLAAGDRVSGTSADYAMEHDVMYTFSINIDGQGDDGVMIPEDEIVPTVDRVWRAVSLIANEVLAL